jgi:glycosyltransferase involved in cell wall biosynthesis
MKDPDVFVGYLHPNLLSASFHKSITDLRLYDMMGNNRIASWGAVRAGGYGLPESRNTVADHVLAEPRFEWLLWVDADMGFAPDVLDRLLEHADPKTRPIVGGLCFAYQDQGFDAYNGIRNQPKPTIYDWVDGSPKGVAHYPVNSLVPSWGTGMALVLIHRTVLEKVHDKYGADWFDRIPRQKTKVGDGPYGEDISFFIRCQSLEIPCYVHTGIRASHHKEIFVQEEDFWQSFHAPPATQTVDVIVPTVTARSKNIPALAASLKASTGLARLVLVLDDETHADSLEEAGVDTSDSIIHPGSFPVKVNAGYKATQRVDIGEQISAPWIQVVGDDCRFHPGWLDHQQWVADLYKAKVVGSNDLANPRVIRGEHATHWMVARDYIDDVGAGWDGPGVVAHEGYKHWFCDDEIVVAAKQRGVFQPALGAVIEHLHPITGLVETDEVYETNDKYAARDKTLFEKRLRAHVD